MWFFIVRAIILPRSTGTAFPIHWPTRLKAKGSSSGANLYVGGNVCKRAPSLSESARFCVGWPNRPVPYPTNCVVIVGDGSLYSLDQGLRKISDYVNSVKIDNKNNITHTVKNMCVVVGFKTYIFTFIYLCNIMGELQI